MKSKEKENNLEIITANKFISNEYTELKDKEESKKDNFSHIYVENIDILPYEEDISVENPKHD